MHNKACHLRLHTPSFLQMATQVVGSLLALEAMDETEDIRIYLNSTGEWPMRQQWQFFASGLCSTQHLPDSIMVHVFGMHDCVVKPSPAV